MKRADVTMKRIVSILLLLGAASVWAGDITLDAPVGGWRHSSTEDQAFMQTVNYPAVKVNVRDTTAVASMIRGHIANVPKKPKPVTMVINGVAMPQRVEATGEFARPYAFSSGSNSVEVRGANGERKRVQVYDSYSGRTKPHIRVVLSWDSDGTDLDLHLVTPSGEHIFYGNRQAKDGSALDVDVTTGYGPEIIASPSQQHGTYLVYVNYYGAGFYGEGENDRSEEMTTAQIAIITDEGTPREKQQQFIVPMRKPGKVTLVKAFQYP